MDLSSPSLPEEVAKKGFMDLIPHIKRRGFLAGAATFIIPLAARASSLPAIPASREIHFKIFRNGTAIGEQLMNFTQIGNRLIVDSTADMVVRIAGIPIFHYRAEVVEHWLDGNFHQLESHINHNGEKLIVAANPIPNGFAIESTKAGDYQYTGSQKMMPLTYWNKAMLESMILNVETGHHYPATVNSPGWNWLETVEGGKILAQRFDVTGHLHFSVWYDQSGQWAGLEFHVDGHERFQKYAS